MMERIKNLIYVILYVMQDIMYLIIMLIVGIDPDNEKFAKRTDFMEERIKQKWKIVIGRREK